MPAALRERILEMVSRKTGGVQVGSGAALHDQLEQLGNQLLAQAIALPPCRETAVTLLAADALMTFACEAAAELDLRS